MSSILLRTEDPVAYLQLNRPEVFNAFNREMALELQELLDRLALDASVRVIVITGIGKAFCAGQDLKEVTTPELHPGFRTILEDHYNPIIRKIRNMPKPVVAAVNGVAAGAGANIALSCDLVIASSSASFIQAFSKIGLVPDSGGTYFLPRLVGTQKAMALCLLGDKVNALDAANIGMIYKCVDAEVFENETSVLTKSLATLPAQALALTKKLLHKSWHHSLEEQLQMEAELQIEASDSKDYQEGVAAFIEKRKPNFNAD
ncbi:MAG: enoyl-CoA hydratase-related protein [Bacteroidia bacterium]|jgi:2-(1,2-epoxy-1,2-dihydrophenyl)acetyl-CoA isomerase